MHSFFNSMHHLIFFLFLKQSITYTYRKKASIQFFSLGPLQNPYIKLINLLQYHGFPPLFLMSPSKPMGHYSHWFISLFHYCSYIQNPGDPVLATLTFHVFFTTFNPFPTSKHMLHSTYPRTLSFVPHNDKLPLFRFPKASSQTAEDTRIPWQVLSCYLSCPPLLHQIQSLSHPPPPLLGVCSKSLLFNYFLTLLCHRGFFLTI